MNFCAAILILKMEKDTFSAYYALLFKENKNATQKTICAEGAVTDWTLLKVV